MRLYIAGPMTGMAAHNYPAFHAAAVALMDAGHVPLNPAGDRPGCHEWLDFMRASLHDLASCDGIATLSGWQTSRGAKLEVHIATMLDLPARPVHEWLAIAADPALDPDAPPVSFGADGSMRDLR